MRTLVLGRKREKIEKMKHEAIARKHRLAVLGGRRVEDFQIVHQAYNSQLDREF